MWFGEPHLFPKEDHLPEWARPDNKVTKGDRVERFDVLAAVRQRISFIWDVTLLKWVMESWRCDPWKWKAHFFFEASVSDYPSTLFIIPRAQNPHFVIASSCAMSDCYPFPNPHAKVSPIVGCPQLHIQCIFLLLSIARGHPQPEDASWLRD